MTPGRVVDDRAVETPRDTFGAAALALSVLWLGGLGSLLAVILATVARRRAGPRQPEATGGGLAGAGLVLGVAGLVVTVGLIGLALVVNGTKVGPVTVHPASSSGMDIVLSPDGSTAYITEPASNRLLVVDTRTGATRATVVVGDTPTGVAVSPDGAQVWVVNTQLGNGSPGALESVTVVASDTESVIATITTPVAGSLDVALSPDGRRAYVTNNGVLGAGSVSVIDTADFSLVATLHGPPSSSPWHPTSVAVSPDGRQVWVSDVGIAGPSPVPVDGLDVFDAGTDEFVAHIAVGAGPFFLDLSRDGREAYVADKLSCDIREIDTTTLAVVATVPWPPVHGCPFGIAAGPTDNLVYAVTGDDHTIDEGRAGNAFGSVNFTTLTTHVHDGVGSDPVTVTLGPDGTMAYVLDADRPVVDLVNPETGVAESTWALPAMAPTTTVAGFP